MRLSHPLDDERRATATAVQSPASHMPRIVWTKASSIARHLLCAATPTPFRKSEQPQRTTSTSWMDGLRGICAVIVLNFHFLFAFTPLAILGYQTPTHFAASNHFAALPPFCLLWDGASCVNVFFAIAGYVCSWKALQLMHEGKASHGTLLQSLSSSVFRRGFRLYLPVLAMTLFTASFAFAHGMILTDAMFADRKTWFPGTMSEVNVPRYDTVWQQATFWFFEISRLMNVWEFKPIYPILDPHLWTIAYEYRMSLHLYVVLLALATLRPRVRLCSLCGLAILYPAWHRWEGLLFFAGAAGAQWDLIRNDAAEAVSDELLPTKEATRELQPSATVYTRPWLLSRPTRTSAHRLFAYLFALYLMSYSVSGFKTPSPGYTWINNFIPPGYAHRESKFPKSVGVLLLLYLLRDSAKGGKPGLWRSLLECELALYLGRISFALYLVHATVLHAIGYALPHWIWASFGGGETMSSWLLGMVVGWVASLILCLYLADVFHREVELRCVCFVKRLEDKCGARK